MNTIDAEWEEITLLGVMATPANLDAFIEREDFFIESPNPGEEFTPKEIGVDQED